MLNVNTKKENNRFTVKDKILLTLGLLFLYRIGNNIPLGNIDQEALQNEFLKLQANNSIIQVLSMYTSGGTSGITAFSLGIIPYINASIILDLITALIPALEKLQSEEGESGRKRLLFYKKIVTIILSIVQSIFILNYLKPYIYNTEFFELFLIVLQTVTGSLMITWMTLIIDKRGIGNGTSIIVLANIVGSFFPKLSLFVTNLSSFYFFDIALLFLIILLIYFSQTFRGILPVVSARQLTYLETMDLQDLEQYLLVTQNGLLIKLNQAGIFPIIIASNLLPFFAYFTSNIIDPNKGIGRILYYFLIIIFNYFYTTIFWDPEKISEKLRKSSVSILNVRPGIETVDYLQQKVQEYSIGGGIILCFIVLFYDIARQLTGSLLLNQLNISSLIIAIGVSIEIQKNIRGLSAATIK